MRIARSPFSTVVSLALCSAVHLPMVSAQDCPQLTGRWPYGPSLAVAASGTHTFFASGSAILVADTSDPGLPRVVGEVVLPAFIYEVALVGDYAYVAASSGGLRIVDVSFPSSPVEIGSCELSRGAFSVTVSGAYAYVGAGDGLHVIDVSNPTSPTEAGASDGPIGYGVAVSGGYA